MLLVVFALVFLAMVVGGIVGAKRSFCSSDSEWWFLVAFGGFLLIALLGVWVGVYSVNIQGIAGWRVFKDYNVQNYAVTVSETRAILSEKAFMNVFIEGSLEKTQVGAEVSKRITEWRDSVNKYNSTVASMRAIRGNWLFGPLVMPRIPDDLTPLVIGG